MKNINKRGYTIFASLLITVQGAIVPPPWADPTYNPCASQPGGWQLIYWPPDKKCYRIFSRGYPCPETMELGPGPDKGTPECNCPPGSAQSARDSRCYPLYHKEPCDNGEYFAPLTIKTDRRRWGTCQKAEKCLEQGHLLWPKDGRCYPRNSRGPCPEGLLLAADDENKFIGKCKCENNGELQKYYWPPTGTCHEFYTSGPCQERGGLFLPGATCGCQPDLPHYHNSTGRCYQLGGLGPCPGGHQFIVPPLSSLNNTNINIPSMRYAECICKEGHIKWFGDGACYRPYTRGPCAAGNLYSVNITSTGMAIGCIPLPCSAGKLYFPAGNGCHRVGTPGPCPNGQVVLFQDSVKTSVEGISYLGMCGCPNTGDANSFYPTLYKAENITHCNAGALRTLDTNSINNQATVFEPSKQRTQDVCGNKRGVIAWSDGTCKQLYTQGTCGAGEWVVPDRSKGQRKGRGWKMGKCECRPGYTVIVDDHTNVSLCQPPTVAIARFLNNKTEKVSKYSLFKGGPTIPTSEETKSEQEVINKYKQMTTNKREENRKYNSEELKQRSETAIKDKLENQSDSFGSFIIKKGLDLTEKSTHETIPNGFNSTTSDILPEVTKIDLQDRRYKSVELTR